jgi:mono/diheme cytochrome c family protein
MGGFSRYDSARALALCAALVCASSASAEGLASMSRGWIFNEQGGAALYAHVCAACHQQDGNGAIGAAAYPALAGNSKLDSAPYVETLVLVGVRNMPAVGQMMSDQQVADVVNYVRARFGADQSDALSAADVAAARPKRPPP